MCVYIYTCIYIYIRLPELNDLPVSCRGAQQLECEAAVAGEAAAVFPFAVTVTPTQICCCLQSVGNFAENRLLPRVAAPSISSEIAVQLL